MSGEMRRREWDERVKRMDDVRLVEISGDNISAGKISRTFGKKMEQPNPWSKQMEQPIPRKRNGQN